MKTFIVKNAGVFPVSVKSIYVGATMCEGYGFVVIGCTTPFKLDPQSERMITIGYSSEYERDTVETDLYFITTTYKLHMRIRAEFFEETGEEAGEASSNRNSIGVPRSEYLEECLMNLKGSIDKFG